MSNIPTLFLYETAKKETTTVRHCWVDISDDFIAGALMSQIMYWSTPDKNNKDKLRVFKDGDYWIAKTYNEWEEELKIPARTIKHALVKLVELNLVIKDHFMFNGLKTLHLRVNFEEVSIKLEEWFKLNLPEEYGNLTHNGKVSSVVQNSPEEEKKGKRKRVEVSSTDEELTKLINTWNSNRGSLPEATLTEKRKAKIEKIYREHGLEKSLELIERATKVVAQDKWWIDHRYNLDNLFNGDKYIGKSESYTDVKAVTKLEAKISSYQKNQDLGY